MAAVRRLEPDLLPPAAMSPPPRFYNNSRPATAEFAGEFVGHDGDGLLHLNRDLWQVRDTLLRGGHGDEEADGDGLRLTELLGGNRTQSFVGPPLTANPQLFGQHPPLSASQLGRYHAWMSYQQQQQPTAHQPHGYYSQPFHPYPGQPPPQPLAPAALDPVGDSFSAVI